MTKTKIKPTNRHWSILLSALFAGGLLLAGCQEPGPAEEAGREIDDAVEEAQEAFEDLGEDAEEALEELEEEID